jgi:two-component system sensor histidine kinase AlgZ
VIPPIPAPHPATRPGGGETAVGVDTTLLNTGFGALGADSGRDPGRVAAAPERSAFDVCHVGVVLRALLFVHGVLALGTAFSVGEIAQWGLQFAIASGVAMPALMWWLLTACLAQRWLARRSVALQWTLATLWGLSLIHI